MNDFQAFLEQAFPTIKAPEPSERRPAKVIQLNPQYEAVRILVKRQTCKNCGHTETYSQIVYVEGPSPHNPSARHIDWERAEGRVNDIHAQFPDLPRFVEVRESKIAFCLECVTHKSVWNEEKKDWDLVPLT